MVLHADGVFALFAKVRKQLVYEAIILGLSQCLGYFQVHFGSNSNTLIRKRPVSDKPVIPIRFGKHR